jgi:subtilisin family serine protease
MTRTVLAVLGRLIALAATLGAVHAMDDPHYQGAGLWGQSFDNQWAIKRVGYTDQPDSAWNGADQGLNDVVVAVIDTGLDWFHPDFPRNAIWKNQAEIADNGLDDDGNGYTDDMIGWNFVRNNNKPWDHDGHGTFVAGVIAAGHGNQTGIAGINPNAKIMVLKALDEFGQGHASMIAEAIVYAADNGARVLNLSLAGRQLTRTEQLAVDHARSKGAVVVVAAGNSASEVEKYSPAGLKGVITVSATTRADKRAGFSNWGPSVDISAPGVDVLSLRARNTDILAYMRGVDYEPGDSIVGDSRAYYRASGTSFSTPIVAGTLSLIFARFPDLTADQARRMVLHSARDIETTGVDNYTGYGMLDAAAALRADPEFYVDARIDGVGVVATSQGQALRVSGTIGANDFEEAAVLLGKGETPEKWLRVKKRLNEPVSDGPLIDLPASVFRGAKQWTIRIITKHRNGATRESRFTVSLG